MARKAQKILVTGGAGFIGSEFVRQAAALGRHLVVVDQLTYAGDLARLKSVKGKFIFHKADIANAKKMAVIFKKERPNVVMHFAAESHVDRSIKDDTTFVRTNILGTQNLLNISRQAGINKFVHMSTDEVYGSIAKGKFKESSPLQPNSPYASSKAAADLMVGSYVHTFQFPATIVRATNNYGPWQHPEKFIPVVILNALRNQKIPVYAQGLNMREWLHVSDCADALLKVVDYGKLGETYNLGSGDEQRNIDVARMILDLLHKPKNLIQFVQDRLGHDWRYSLDSTKIKNNLSWKPRIKFEQGIIQAVQWYQKT